tara:strand:- start:512 stop:688 length:177 start_codon:yes stop_codon:yes gene_type:complete
MSQSLKEQAGVSHGKSGITWNVVLVRALYITADLFFPFFFLYPQNPRTLLLPFLRSDS